MEDKIKELENKCIRYMVERDRARGENEVLKEKYEKADYDRHKLFEQKEKAIEYIKQSIDNPQPFYEYLFGDENGKVENLDKLLNILQGDDKND